MRHGNHLGWSLGNAFSAGYYWAVVPTEEYSKLDTPLDVARRKGAVRVLQAATFGHMGGETWIQIQVPSDYDGNEADTLKDWATWWVGKRSDTVEQKISPDEMKGGVKTEVFETADKLSKEGADFIDESAKRLSGFGVGFLALAGGVVALTLLFRSKGSK